MENDTGKDKAGNLVALPSLNRSNRDFERREIELIDDSEDYENFRENLNEKIWVKSNITDSRTDGGARVAYTEKIGEQEVLIYGQKPTLVPLSKGVANALNERILVKATLAEIADYDDQRNEKARAQLERQKQKHLENFIALTGSAENFDAVWEQIKAKELANTLLQNF